MLPFRLLMDALAILRAQIVIIAVPWVLFLDRAIDVVQIVFPSLHKVELGGNKSLVQLLNIRTSHVQVSVIYCLVEG